jgi:asparagine synthase (glutamine-hydrolysing)
VCGLGGGLHFDGLAANVQSVERMSPCLRFRGPDGYGAWTAGPVTFLHLRLKIIDLSDAGAQADGATRNSA